MFIRTHISKNRGYSRSLWSIPNLAKFWPGLSLKQDNIALLTRPLSFLSQPQREQQNNNDVAFKSQGVLAQRQVQLSFFQHLGCQRLPRRARRAWSWLMFTANSQILSANSTYLTGLHANTHTHTLFIYPSVYLLIIYICNYNYTYISG
jgi:hypothetical protein